MEITCLCGNIQEKVVVDPDKSVPADVCHCNICRWTTGTLFYYALPLLEPPKCVAKLSKYDSTEKVSRYFCDGCGTHICHKVHINNAWYVAWGVVDKLPSTEQVASSGVPRIAQHQFIAETLDGGLAICLANSSEAPAEFFLQASNSSTVDPRNNDLFTVTSYNTASDRLRAACHCGGVEFYLIRPNDESKQCSSPWPDLLYPYRTHDSANPDDVKWWLRGNQKYLAGTCACRTCRLANSSPITTFAFVPMVNIKQRDGSPINASIGTLKSHPSSEGRLRDFCRVCGASVFLRIEERPELWDVNIGLFRAPEGARAETWFEWVTTRVSFAEDAVDKELVNTCEVGLKYLNRYGT